MAGSKPMITPRPDRHVMQCAHVVSDIEDACMKWVKTTGIGPFFLIPHIELQEFTYRGRPGEGLDFSVAIAQAGGVQIELIQQHCDRPSVYRDLIAKGQSGFHHIGLYCGNYDEVHAWYADQGYVAGIEGLFGTMRFAYFDTSADIGCMVELIEHADFETEFFNRIAAAAEDWDGKTDPIRPGFPG